MGEAFGLYTHIRNNQRRSALLIGGLFVLVAAVTFAITLIIESQAGGGGFEAIVARTAGRMPLFLPIAFAATALWVKLGLKANTALIAWATDSRALAREESPRLFRLVEPLCISRGMAIPRLMVMESEALNAFASGVDAGQFTITVTRGLLDALNDQELEAVLAHELTHIRNGDVKLMIVAVLIAGVVSFFGEMAVRGGTRFTSLQVTHRGGDGGDRRGSGAGLAVILGIAILVVAWFFGVLIRFSLSRSREYLADAGAVELTKNPDALIAALLKISGRADIDGVPSGIMDMCIENDPNDFGDIFSTHPSIGKRIQALQAYAGGVMPSRQPPAPPLLRQRQPLPEIVEQRGPWGAPFGAAVRLFAAPKAGGHGAKDERRDRRMAKRLEGGPEQEQAAEAKSAAPPWSRRIGQFIRFFGVGLVAVAVHYGLMVLLVEAFGSEAVRAAVTGYIGGGFVSYALNRRFTYDTARSHGAAAWRFALVAGGGLVLTWVFMALFSRLLGWHYLIAQLITTGIVLFWSFFAHKHWTFGDKT